MGDPISVVVAGFLAQYLATHLLDNIAGKSIATIVKGVEEQARREGVALTDGDRGAIEALLSGEYHESWLERLVPYLKYKVTGPERAGLLIVGPSGAGKTSLHNFLVGDPSLPHASTTRRTAQDGRFAGRYVSIVDTPGAPHGVAMSSETFAPLASEGTCILILMFAGGYLSTTGLDELRRPGGEPHATMDSYLAACRKEEEAWISNALKNTPSRSIKIPYCMVVINKQNLWNQSFDQVLARYQEGPMRAAIDLALKAWCIEGASPTFHPVSCFYDSFKGQLAPDPAWSMRSTTTSKIIVRAQILLRLIEYYASRD